MSTLLAISNVNLLERMAASGVPFQDAHWFHCVARRRGLLNAAERGRARDILWTVAQRSTR